MKKKPTKKKLKNILWRTVSKYVRTIEESCYTCGNFIPDFGERQAGHGWTKGGHSFTTFDPMNVHTQCVGCNLYNHGRSGEYQLKLIMDYGMEETILLKQRSKSQRIFDINELSALITFYQTLIKFPTDMDKLKTLKQYKSLLNL